MSADTLRLEPGMFVIRRSDFSALRVLERTSLGCVVQPVAGGEASFIPFGEGIAIALPLEQAVKAAIEILASHEQTPKSDRLKLALAGLQISLATHGGAK